MRQEIGEYIREHRWVFLPLVSFVIGGALVWRMTETSDANPVVPVSETSIELESITIPVTTTTELVSSVTSPESSPPFSTVFDEVSIVSTTHLDHPEGTVVVVTGQTASPSVSKRCPRPLSLRS